MKVFISNITFISFLEIDDTALMGFSMILHQGKNGGSKLSSLHIMVTESWSNIFHLRKPEWLV